MSDQQAIDILVDDPIFAESPRWHAGAFWFSDIGGGTVRRLGADARREITALEIPAPSGHGRILATRVDVSAARPPDWR